MYSALRRHAMPCATIVRRFVVHRIQVDSRHATYYNAFTSMATQEENAENVTIRLTPETLRQLDAIVAQAKGGPGDVSRSSLVRHWIERGIKEARRPR
jgi:hypothetical protein